MKNNHEEKVLNNVTPVKPFLKWAGGKGQLIKEIEKYYPFSNKNITKYAEPFIGGGAVLFDILNKFDLKKIYISDTNAELVNCYKIIKNNVDELIISLEIFESEFLPKNITERKEYFYNKRDKFNYLKSLNSQESVEKAALMVFLNRTCFNGLYRVNKKGEFNVPIGNYKNPLICDKINLISISKKLKNVNIVYGDYKSSEKFIDNNTFVYFDPPYRPLNETSSFISYTENLFTDKEQIELSQYALKLTKKGAKVLLSNSDPKNINEYDDFFDKIYKDFFIKRVGAVRMINSNSSKRGQINELLISNFNAHKKMEV